MILTGPAIKSARDEGTITIEPFDVDLINPNSYDFCLGRTLLRYTEKEVDTRCDNRVETLEIPEEGFVIPRGDFFLGHTLEVMGSTHYAPIIRAKSSMARLGLFVHVTADLIDIGSINQFTLQLYATHAIRVYAGMRVGQVTFWRAQGDITLYDGKYQGSVGPVASRSYRDSACES